MSVNKKNLLIGWGLLAWWLAAAWHSPNLVWSAYNSIVWFWTWVFEWTKQLVTNIIWPDWWAFVWSLAPFAAPALWAFAGYKLADAMEIESKTLKFAANVWGIWAGIAIWAASTPYLPAIATAWLLYGTYRFGKWSLWGIWKKVWLVKS